MWWWLAWLLVARAEPVEVQIDWQAHPSMHIPWFMFGKGLTERPLRGRTWRHQFRQTISEPTLSASGVRIFLAAAMAAERARTPRQARRLIERQFDHVEAFVAAHSDRYALARTPEQARMLLATTEKMVVVHSIEGGHHLLWTEADVQSLARRGVALVTLIHLRDEELGGAELFERPGLARLVNPRGVRAERRGERRGLTEHGRQAMVWLDEAGILVDLAHLSDASLDDALAVAGTHDIAPVITHGQLERTRDGEFAISDEQLVELYRLGGVFSLGLSANKLSAEHTSEPAPAAMCWGTVHSWAWAHQVVQRVLADHVALIFERPGLTVADLDASEQIRLATGWSSDFNGWVSHSRPVYGPQGCLPADQASSTLDSRGLAHPGVLPEHWQAVEAQGVSLQPMLRSAERFLQLWEAAAPQR